jgi:hypothetical protein
MVYTFTVAKHMKPAGMKAAQEWILSKCDKVIGKDTAIQSATGKKASISNESWPGATCKAILQEHDGLLNAAWGTLNRIGCEDHIAGLAAWRAFVKWNTEVGAGCDDEQSSRDSHGDRLEKLAEEFRVVALDLVIPAERFTYYLHSMNCHMGDLARRHGSLVRLSSQGLEAMHQSVKFTANSRCNRQPGKMASTMIIRLSLKAAACGNPALRHHNEGGRLKRPGGHVSKAVKERRQDARSRLQDEGEDEDNDLELV